MCPSSVGSLKIASSDWIARCSKGQREARQRENLLRRRKEMVAVLAVRASQMAGKLPESLQLLQVDSMVDGEERSLTRSTIVLVPRR